MHIMTKASKNRTNHVEKKTKFTINSSQQHALISVKMVRKNLGWVRDSLYSNVRTECLLQRVSDGHGENSFISLSHSAAKLTLMDQSARSPGRLPHR